MLSAMERRGFRLRFDWILGEELFDRVRNCGNFTPCQVNEMNSEDAVSLAPFRLEPMFVERVWGILDLNPWYDYVAKGQPIGEVWLSGDECKVATGPLAGESLGAIFAQYSKEMLGAAAPTWAASMSPLLMKLIFAKEKLSVQVHPDDRLAKKYGEPR